MNIPPPPPPINALATALLRSEVVCFKIFVSGTYIVYPNMVYPTYLHCSLISEEINTLITYQLLVQFHHGQSFEANALKPMREIMYQKYLILPRIDN